MQSLMKNIGPNGIGTVGDALVGFVMENLAIKIDSCQHRLAPHASAISTALEAYLEMGVSRTG